MVRRFWGLTDILLVFFEAEGGMSNGICGLSFGRDGLGYPSFCQICFGPGLAMEDKAKYRGLSTPLRSGRDDVQFWLGVGFGRDDVRGWFFERRMRRHFLAKERTRMTMFQVPSVFKRGPSPVIWPLPFLMM